jgi:hypothetical protein
MGLFDRSNKDASEGKEPRHDDQRHPEASGADSGGLGGDTSWIEEEEARDQSQRPWDPDGRTDLPESRGSDARVTSEAPDRPDYDPSGDAYFQDKLPGAQAREDYARSLVPPGGDPNDEYRWHTGRVRPTGVPDAVEFIEVHKAFGRNKILRGLNMGIPEGKISMILGPSGTGKSVCIKHMVGLLYPDDGDVLVHGESVPNMVDDRLTRPRTSSRTSSRAACESAPASRARSCSIRTSSCSTSPTRGWTRCAPPCCASSSRRSTRRTAAPTWSSPTTS